MIIMKPAGTELPPGSSPQPYVEVDGHEFSASQFRFLRTELNRAQTDAVQARAGESLAKAETQRIIDRAATLAAYSGAE